MTDLSSAHHARLFTAFGTVLYVDATSGELRHGPIDSSPANAMFVADESSPEKPLGSLVHEQAGKSHPIACSTEGSWSTVGERTHDTPGTPTKFDLIRLGAKLLGLRAGNLYLCAEPTGKSRFPGRGVAPGNASYRQRTRAIRRQASATTSWNLARVRRSTGRPFEH